MTTLSPIIRPSSPNLRPSSPKIHSRKNTSGPTDASILRSAQSQSVVQIRAPQTNYGAVDEAAPLASPSPMAPDSALLRQRRLRNGSLFALYGFVFGHFLSQLPVSKERLNIGDGAFAAWLLADDLGNFAALAAAHRLPALYGGSMPAVGAGLSVAAGAAALCRNKELFGASMLTFGALSSLFDVAANVQMVALEAASGRPETSLCHGLFSAGQLTGSAIGAAVTWADWPFEARVAGVTLAIVTAFLAHGSQPRVEATQTPQEHPEPGHRRWALLGLAAAGFLSSVGEGVASEWPGIYLRQDLRTSFRTANLAGLAYASGMTTARLLGGRFIQAVGPRPVLVAGGALATASMVAALNVNQPWAVLAAVAAVGAGLANVSPLTVSAAGSLPGNVAGALAWMTLAQQAGFFSGPPIVGALSSVMGLRLALGTLPLVGLGVALSALAIKLPARPREAHAASPTA